MAEEHPPPYSGLFPSPKNEPSAPGYSPPKGYGTSQQGGYPPPGYPPPQAGYPPPQATYQSGAVLAPTENTVILTQPAITVMQTFREIPVRTICPHCRADIVTQTKYDTGAFTWLVCAILCLLGCVLGCCLIPFCVDGCQDVIHSCPNCHQQISRWARI